MAILGVSCLGCKITSEATDAGASATGGSGGAGSGTGGTPVGRTCSGTPTITTGPTGGPCDIYAADGGPCVAAHSTVRALYAAYNGPALPGQEDRGRHDHGHQRPRPPAASRTRPTRTRSAAPPPAPSRSSTTSRARQQPDQGARGRRQDDARQRSQRQGAPGHVQRPQRSTASTSCPGSATGTTRPAAPPTGDNPETEYMVVGGTFYNGGCCFDYGNMETTSRDDGEGTMEAVYFGNCTIWGKGADNGPWVMGDLENGLWAGNVEPVTPTTCRSTYKYVTGMVKGDDAGKNHWTIKGGNAQSGTLDDAVRRPAPQLAIQPDEEGRRHRPRHRWRQQQRRHRELLRRGHDHRPTRRTRPTTPCRPTSSPCTAPRRSRSLRPAAARCGGVTELPRRR